MGDRLGLNQFDLFLFVSAVILALVGALGIYNASADGGNSSLFTRQILWIVLGVAACLIARSVDYHFLADHAFLLYGLSGLLLLGSLLFGTEINGSKSWISFWGGQLPAVRVHQDCRGSGLGPIPV